MIESCDSTSINSHLLQKKGLLSNLAPNGHLIEVKVTDPFKWKENSKPIEFKSVGINKALSLSLFCNHHDTNIFLPIESDGSNFETYESFLLLSYRTVCAELRKKQIAKEIYCRIDKSKNAEGKINKEFVIHTIKGLELGIQDLFLLKKMLEMEIAHQENKFSYFVFKYPSIGIYSSAIFSANDLFDSEDYEIDQCIYLHILPLEDCTMIILGYHNNYTSKKIIDYCQAWGGLSQHELEIRLTNIMCYNTESWGISIETYKRIPPKKIEQLLEIIIQHSNQYGISKKSEFNIFQKD